MISGSVLPVDFLHAHRLHRKTVHLYAMAFGAALFVLGVTVSVVSDPKLGITLACGGIGAATVEALTFWAYMPFKTKSLFRQQVALQSIFTYSWDSKTFTVAGSSGSSKRQWTDLWKVKEGRSVLLLYHSDSLFQIVPKRWFMEDKSLRDFVSYAQANARAA